MGPKHEFFWDQMMREQAVYMDDRPTFKGEPDAFFFESQIPQEPFVSPYNNGDVLVGEIVEDEQLELGA